MLVKLILIVTLVLPAFADIQPPPAATQPPRAEQPPQEPPDSAIDSAPMEGLWPSPKLMDQLLRRRALEIGEQLDLDETQRARIERDFVKRWTTFLNENRPRIQPLLNEFIELRTELEPPQKEKIQAWAERAMPVFQQVRQQIDEGASEVRGVLRPMQRAKFDLRAGAFKAGVFMAEQKLKTWQSGEFAPKDFWEPTRSKRREMREERRQRQSQRQTEPVPRQSESETGDQVALELNAWERYVQEFIKRYDLDEAQRTTVLSCLSELKQRAIAHRDRRRDDITRLEQRIAQHDGSKDDIAAIEEQLVELYGPIDDMFAELKTRLEATLTTEQRAKLTESDKTD